MDSRKRLDGAKSQLKEALDIYDQAAEDKRALPFLTVCKAFEVLVEYAWKELKLRVQDEGLDAPSPKEAVRQAGRLGIIDSTEDWISCIIARNDSVHDYFNIPEADYIALTRLFLQLADKL